jgi:hypothetical protein
MANGDLKTGILRFLDDNYFGINIHARYIPPVILHGSSGMIQLGLNSSQLPAHFSLHSNMFSPS